jgi:hypothetical protein
VQIPTREDFKKVSEDSSSYCQIVLAEVFAGYNAAITSF